MKVSVELTEDDIKMALSNWFEQKHGRSIAVKDISLTVIKGDDDPRGPTPDRVRATLTHDL